MPNIPNDPIILLSYVNTQLRDNYSSLDSLCIHLNVEQKSIIDKLKAINYEYNPSLNKFS